MKMPNKEKESRKENPFFFVLLICYSTFNTKEHNLFVGKGISLDSFLHKSFIILNVIRSYITFSGKVRSILVIVAKMSAVAFQSLKMSLLHHN